MGPTLSSFLIAREFSRALVCVTNFALSLVCKCYFSRFLLCNAVTFWGLLLSNSVTSWADYGVTQVPPPFFTIKLPRSLLSPGMGTVSIKSGACSSCVLEPSHDFLSCYRWSAFMSSSSNPALASTDPAIATVTASIVEQLNFIASIPTMKPAIPLSMYLQYLEGVAKDAVCPSFPPLLLAWYSYVAC